VCVPHPVGHPLNFRPLADVLARSGFAVLGVEPPGHDLRRRGPFASVQRTAELVVAELGRRLEVPILLWGHCGGAALALETARRLEHAGFDLRALLIGSKLLPPVTDMLESIEMIENWTDDDVVRYLADESGMVDLDGADAAHRAFVVDVFRHDVLTGYRYLVGASERGGPRLATPLWSVVADDDAGLAPVHAIAHRRWELLAEDVREARLPTGGHYFMRTEPGGTAAVVTGAWDANRTEEEG
jgi:surfactin synthase thioesterase subunit